MDSRLQSQINVKFIYIDKLLWLNKYPYQTIDSEVLAQMYTTDFQKAGRRCVQRRAEKRKENEREGANVYVFKC
jgi:hypothetical protein